MKKLLTIILSFGILNAGFFSTSPKQTLSSIKPAPTIYLEPLGVKCNQICLNEFLSSGMYLSFLANYQIGSNASYDTIYTKLQNSIVQDFEIWGDRKVKIAIVIPHKITKSISAQVINSALSYLIRRGDDIEFRVFLTSYDSKQAMQSAINQIKANNYLVVISPNTPQGARILADELDQQVLYFPNLSPEDLDIMRPSVKFGGLDYDKQISALLELNRGKIAIITDKDALFSKLNTKIQEQSSQDIYILNKSSITNPKKVFEKNQRLSGAGVFLNLKLVDVVLFANQIRAYDVAPSALYATQVAYHPALLRIGQSEDLSQLFIANSLESNDAQLNYINEFLGVDLNYNHIAYATSAGLDSIYATSFGSKIRYFENDFSNSALIYPTHIYKIKNKSFYKLK